MSDSRDTDRNYSASRRPDLVLDPAKGGGDGEKIDVLVMGLGSVYTIEVNLNATGDHVDLSVYDHANEDFVDMDTRSYSPEEREA